MPMDKPHIFSATLGLSAPWSITSIRFSSEDNRLDIDIIYDGGAAIKCPECGCDAHTQALDDETWYHSDFFRYTAYLHARVPLVECANCDGCRRVAVPWARPGTKFQRMESQRLPADTDPSLNPS
jgi:transposase